MLARLGVLLNGHAAGPSGKQELAGVVPVDRVDLAARIQRLGLLRAAKIPNGDNGGVLSHCGQESTILREEQALDGAGQSVVRSRRTGLDIENLDLPVNATGSNEVAVGVELDR